MREFRFQSAWVAWLAMGFSIQASATPTDVCSRTAAQLQILRNQEADQFVSAFAASPGGGGLNYSGQACSWNCSTPATDSRNACMARLLDVARYSCVVADRELGQGVPDDQYFAEANQKFSGHMMEIPPEIIPNAIGDGDVGRLRSELDRHPEWRYLEYSSTSINNSPDGFARILIYVPGESYDRWVQIAINPGPPRRFGRNVDFIAVQKRSETGAALTPPQVYFRGYSRLSAGFTPEGHGTGHSLTRCYSCHPSGPRMVFPATGSYAAGAEAVVREFRRAMSAVSPSGYGPHYDPDRFGPPLGVPDAKSSDRWELISRGCARTVPEARRRVIMSNMSCTDCHNGADRGVLNAGTDVSTIHHKVVENDIAPMPPDGGTMSRGDREVLFRCLRAEYAEQLRSWLKEQSCSPSPAGNATGVNCPTPSNGAPSVPASLPSPVINALPKLVSPH